MKIVWRESEIWALAVAETLVWAGMFYVFAALISQWEHDLGWSKTDLAAGFTISLLVSAFVSPFAGGMIDKGLGRQVLSGGALLGGVLLALLSGVNAHWQFIVIWALLGLASACCFYEPCFAYITLTRRDQAKPAITLVTLVAGFAGTLAFPLANFLSEVFNWRVASLVFSGLIVFVGFPLFLYATHKPVDTNDADPEKNIKRSDVSSDQRAQKSALRTAMEGWTFWLVALAFGLMALNHSSLITHFLPLMEERKVSLELAVMAASMIGPMQVLGRVIITMIEPWVSNLIVCGLSFVSLILASVFLVFSADLYFLVFGFVIFQGMGIGVSSIMRPVIIAELLGYQDFGKISGAATSIALILNAAAPSIAAIIWLITGYSGVLTVMLLVSVLAALVYVLSVFSRNWETLKSGIERRD